MKIITFAFILVVFVCCKSKQIEDNFIDKNNNSEIKIELANIIFSLHTNNLQVDTGVITWYYPYEFLFNIYVINNSPDTLKFDLNEHRGNYPQELANGKWDIPGIGGRMRFIYNNAELLLMR